MKAILFALASFLLVGLIASASIAQQRTFVSGLGNDANPCSRIAPCRTFGQAISGTSAGGEVVVLDSAGYGAFAINKAVSIIAPPGVYAGISVFSGNGIDINVGSGDTVILSGLTLNGQGDFNRTVFPNGIVFHTAGSLHVESCVVNSFFGRGIGISCIGGGKVDVKDSIVRGNGDGIAISGPSIVAMDQVRLEANNRGLFATDGAVVTVLNCVASDNGTGFIALNTTTANVQLNIESCVASNNTGDGIIAGGNGAGIGMATVRVSDSMVTDNTTGLHNLVTSLTSSPGLLLSRGNNTVEGNTTNTSGTIGSYAAK